MQYSKIVLIPRSGLFASSAVKWKAFTAKSTIYCQRKSPKSVKWPDFDFSLLPELVPTVQPNLLLCRASAA